MKTETSTNLFTGNITTSSHYGLQARGEEVMFHTSVDPYALTLMTGSMPGVLEPGKRTMRAVLNTWGGGHNKVWR